MTDALNPAETFLTVFYFKKGYAKDVLTSKAVQAFPPMNRKKDMAPFFQVADANGVLVTIMMNEVTIIEQWPKGVRPPTRPPEFKP